MQAELHDAYLLHRRSYRESSFLLELFSSQHGRVGAVAKGAIRRNAPGGVGLQPFRPLLVAWTSRRSELVSLTRWETAGPQLLTEGRAILCGFYLNELMLQTLPRHDPHPDTYEHYQRALEMLGRASTDAMEAILRVFEKHLLRAAGYGLILDRDVHTRMPILGESLYAYRPGQGPVLAAPERVEASDVITVSGRTLLALHNERFECPEELTEAKRLMRVLLRVHLGDRPLYSRSWFEEY